ncbi:TonB-dependent hemoglobin/transferrin/lactoferrin family receptor [Hydrogenophilus thiooxidans]|uniref:TonB-dependent hemoglobin/transferrin/lactoferrin family receptor n=1 Tax=Hydrogenophilus thiooxidans TaxID=2820326 RepID=UPI001C24B782|nr:TonB-dependent hemoglobin/transferrin/lactoferrin family receptor [Hydrogenophilus thiooxidans]
MLHLLFPPAQRALIPTTLLLGLVPAAFADDIALKAVVVTATRVEADPDSVPATVTSLDRAEMDRRLPIDAADLFADEPDVAMPRDLRRHGATRVNIRGIEDNRVVQMVDGVRLPDYYNGGGPTNYTMSASPTAMPDFLKRVEVVRGPSSSLYGSDAIGGVVGFVTLDPADLLGAEKTSTFRYRGSYTGANDGLTHTVLGALRNDALELLVGYSRGKGEEFDNQGDVGGSSPTRTKPNPQKTHEEGLLAKLVLKPATGHKLVATIEGRKQSVETDILRLPASLPRVSMMRGDDNSERLRGSLEWEHKPGAGWYDRLTARFYRQDAETKNYNFQNRSATSASCSAVAGGLNNCYIEQDFFFTQETLGAGLQGEKLLQAGGLTHLFTFGADLSRVHVKEMRDVRIWRNGAFFGKTLAGETYPLRDFAIGRTDTLGLFVQDEIIGLAGDRLTLIPGLRFDRTKLQPEVDALAQQVLTKLGRQAVKKTHSALSPKLGAIWRLDGTWSAYGQVARGFRAPNYEEVNGAFLNESQRYAVVPNPDLKPETSLGVELGLRRTAANHRLQLAVYDNRYKNFIESVQLACPGDSDCVLPAPPWRTNQSVNRSRVRIYGAEARGSWTFAPGWRVNGGIAWAHGTNEESGRPINSIEPLRASLGLVREAGSWGAEVRLRAATKKNRVDDSNGIWFRPPGYGVVDLSVWFKPSRDIRLTLAVNNLFDKKYWLWSDIRQADARNPAGVDFYSQPGRSLSLVLQGVF